MRKAVADITLRAVGGVAAQASAIDDFYESRDRMLLLIHGYNVTEDEAVRACRSFRKDLAYYSPVLLNKTFVCTWAGNWRMPPIRPAAYPFMLKRARESSTTLYEAIQSWYRKPYASPELVIVAHSLGCRLTMEMLMAMRARGRPERLRKLTVILMAAAVPTEYMAPGGILHDALAVSDTVAVFYSPADSVLKWYFGLGQSLARDGKFPKAVGLNGDPKNAGWTKVEHMRSYDHGDYWRELEMAEKVCRVLGVSIRPLAMALPLAAQKALPSHRLQATGALPIHLSG
jgi:esterase/lipase superfamily enzyme